jgi:hypothetical protein
VQGTVIKGLKGNLPIPDHHLQVLLQGLTVLNEAIQVICRRRQRLCSEIDSAISGYFVLAAKKN